jgi:hypothetical protein
LKRLRDLFDVFIGRRLVKYCVRRRRVENSNYTVSFILAFLYNPLALFAMFNNKAIILSFPFKLDVFKIF